MLTKRVFNTFKLITSVGNILQTMDDVKGTELYSTRIIKTLEEYDRTKLKRAIWNASGEVCDQAAMGMEMVSRVTYAILTVSTEQPDHVKARFDRDLEELFIRYGVNMQELEMV
jgi:hypothetical protein